MKSQLDSFDLKIINQLRINGLIPVTQLAKTIGMSKSPCQARIKRLEKDGYIVGYTANIDHAKLGQGQVAFAEVRMSNTKEKALDEFNKAVSQIPEIEECYLIAGSFDYLLKVRTEDINAYRKVLAETISNLPYVANTSTYVSMQSVKA